MNKKERDFYLQHESKMSNIRIKVLLELFDDHRTCYKENEYSAAERKQKARKYFARLWEQSEYHPTGTIICEKYDCSFKVEFHGEDDNDSVVILKTRCKEKLTPFSLKELAMVKVAQQISLYEVDTLYWIYSRFLMDLFFHAGDECSRIIWNVNRIIRNQIHRRFSGNHYEIFTHIYRDIDDPERISKNPIPYCWKCYEMEFLNENLHCVSREKHCDVCSLFKNIRFSTSMLNKNGHFSDCCNRK